MNPPVPEPVTSSSEETKAITKNTYVSIGVLVTIVGAIAVYINQMSEIRTQLLVIRARSETHLEVVSTRLKSMDDTLQNILQAAKATDVVINTLVTRVSILEDRQGQLQKELETMKK